MVDWNDIVSERLTMAIATITATPRAVPKKVKAVRTRWRLRLRQEIVVNKRSMTGPGLSRLLLDLTVAKIDSAITEVCRFFAMRYHHDGTTVFLVYLLKQLQYRLAAFRIEITGGLIR